MRVIQNSIAIEANGQAKWHVAQTRSRQEKILAANLQCLNIVSFLPLSKVEREYCGQRLTVDVPLFPGFVFFKGDARELATTECAERIRQIDQVADQERLVDELGTIERAIATNLRLEPCTYLEEKVDVEVRSGALAGLKGVVADIATPHPVVLQITAVQRAVCVPDAAEVRMVGQSDVGD